MSATQELEEIISEAVPEVAALIYLKEIYAKLNEELKNERNK